MKRMIIAAALLATCAGCNTVAGIGEDLQQAGGVLAGTAEGVQRGSGTAQAPTTTDPSPLCAPDAQGRKPSGCPN